jgi:simple sugar transport system permease protein
VPFASRFVPVALFVVAIGAALAASSILVAVTHGPASSVFTAMYNGSVNGWGSFGYTLDYAAPLLLVAVGTIVGVRAGQFNIGQEGQLMMGALAGALVAIRLHGPGPLVLVLALCAAALGGAVWAGITALLRFWRGVDVVISSLLLIFVAGEVLDYAVNHQWVIQERGAGPARQAESDQISSHVRLPRVGHYPHANVGTGFLLALALALTVAVLMARSRWGFRLKILGLNPVAARRAGISAALLGGAAIVLSGAFSGLAGGVMLTGTAYRLTPAFSNNIGWTGLLVALVARNDSIAAVATALLFGALEAGGSFLSTSGIPTDLVPIVQALVVFGVVLPPAFLVVRQMRRDAHASRAVVSAAANGRGTSPVGAP